MMNVSTFFKRKSLHRPSPAGMLVSYVLLIVWALVVLFPMYWLLVTSFKLPIDVNTGPFYIPFVDFQPSLHAWEYILVGDLRNDTIRPYINTVIVSLVSASIALLLGTAAAYALTRFEYRPRLGAIFSFIGCLAPVINYLVAICRAPGRLGSIANSKSCFSNP